MPSSTAEAAPPYDRDAILQEDGPFNPSFMREAIRTLMRTLPLDPAEPQGWQDRRMQSALLSLAALNPRDEIEVMLGVQAISAYHAAAACWRIGMNHHRPNGDSIRHITAAASAARVFDSLLRAIERRQAKPMGVPIGRPACRAWGEQNPTKFMQDWIERCRDGETGFGLEPSAKPEPSVKLESPGKLEPSNELDPSSELESFGKSEPPVAWTEADLAFANEHRERERMGKENEGLDIANTAGILPGGGMILTDEPTPEQAAYMGRRLGLMYRREYEDNLRKGISTIPKIRAIRPGDLIP